MSATSAAASGSSFRLGGRLATLASVVVTAAIIAAVAWAIDPPGGTTAVDLTGDVAEAAPQVGQPPPDFEATLVDGTPVSLSQYAGQPVWLTFGALAATASEAPVLRRRTPVRTRT
jgi:hypothetical protein